MGSCRFWLVPSRNNEITKFGVFGGQKGSWFYNHNSSKVSFPCRACFSSSCKPSSNVINHTSYLLWLLIFRLLFIPHLKCSPFSATALSPFFSCVLIFTAASFSSGVIIIPMAACLVLPPIVFPIHCCFLSGQPLILNLKSDHLIQPFHSGRLRNVVRFIPIMPIMLVVILIVLVVTNVSSNAL